MGAVVTHARELRAERGADAADSEIVPVGGDYDFPAYSSVSRAVEFARSLGIDPNLWPIYYEVRKADISLDEVAVRCAELRRVLGSLAADQLAVDPWLAQFAGWLAAGEDVVITE